ncbi:MAG: response regulator transcription factor [Nitrolancea sp.]
MIRVMLVEDHSLMRRTLREIISAEEDILLVAEATDGQMAVDRALSSKPDVILMDIDLPEISGIEATREIVRWLPLTRVIMLTVSSAEEDLFESLRVGAAGYITKDARRDEIVEAIRAANQGELPLTAAMATRVLAHFRNLRPRDGSESMAVLSEREREVVSLLAAGLRDKEIAHQLLISPATVKKHVEHILRKLQVRTRAEATAKLSAELGDGRSTPDADW